MQFSTISRFEATINCGDCQSSSTVLYFYIYDAQYILCCLDGVYFWTAGTNTRKIAILSVLPCRLCYSQNHSRTMGHRKMCICMIHFNCHYTQQSLVICNIYPIKERTLDSTRLTAHQKRHLHQILVLVQLGGEDKHLVIHPETLWCRIPHRPISIWWNTVQRKTH